MKKLEKEIIEKVYKYETRKTIFEVVLRLVFILFLAFAGLIFGQILFQALTEQKTLDVFEIFTEDIQIIKEYWGDVIAVLYEETPKLTLFIFLILVALLLGALLTLILNFEKIINRIKSLIRYWLRR